ncbi:hypothetical protein EBR03_05800 [bacterium]|nr:hypothetical protein [bacterium]NBX82137.1 hypothetical protein [bacterium]
MTLDSDFSYLRQFFERPICQEVASALKNGAELAIQVGADSYALVKSSTGIQLLPRAANSPDITFCLGDNLPRQLHELTTNDVSELGMTLLSWMFNQHPHSQLKASVHLGPTALFTRGYFSILMRGGSPFMQYLSQKGNKSWLNSLRLFQKKK